MQSKYHVKRRLIQGGNILLIIIFIFIISSPLQALQWMYPENLEMTGGKDLSGGGGTSFGNIGGNVNRPDLVLMKYSREGTSHYRFHYRIGWDVDGIAHTSNWSENMYIDGVGDRPKGAGVAVSDINNNGIADMLLMAFHKSSPNSYYIYRIAWDLDSHGRPTSVSRPIAINGGIGTNVRGAGVSISGLPDVDGKVAVFMVYSADGDRQLFMYRFKHLNEDGSPSTRLSETIFIARSVDISYHSGRLAVSGVVGAGVSFGYLDGNSMPDLILMAKGCPTTRYRYRIVYNLDSNGRSDSSSSGYLEAGAMGFRSSGAGVAAKWLDVSVDGMTGGGDAHSEILMMEVLPGPSISDIKGYSYRVAHDFDNVMGDNENQLSEFGTYYINSDEEWDFRNEARTFRDEWGDIWPEAQSETLRNELFTTNSLDFVDSVDLAYVPAHGLQAMIADNGPTSVDLDRCGFGSYSTSSRQGDADYIVFSSCLTLSMSGTWRRLWRAYTESDLPKPFSGLHGAFGFRSVESASGFHYTDLAEEFSDNLKDGMSVVDAWIDATVTFRDHDGYSDRGSENLGAAFYIRPHRHEIIHHHDSPDYQLIHSDYMLDALYIVAPFRRVYDIEP